jgi:hypothetical protein
MRASRVKDGSAPHILSVVLHHDGIALATIKVGDAYSQKIGHLFAERSATPG